MGTGGPARHRAPLARAGVGRGPRARSRGAKSGPIAGAPCSVVAALFHRAEDRRDLAAQPPLVERLATCDTDSGVAVDRMRTRGDLDGAVALMRRRLALEPDRERPRADLAGVLLAKRDFAGARAELGRLVAEDPSDAQLRVRLADAEVAAGDLSAARRTLAAALARRPDLPDVRRAARAIGLPLPLEDLRIDAKQVIRDYRASGRKYAAPAVTASGTAPRHGVFADGVELSYPQHRRGRDQGRHRALGRGHGSVGRRRIPDVAHEQEGRQYA